jgi:murein DD-endopeptidase MepM/ murein hydrolase activator NlpD
LTLPVLAAGVFLWPGTPAAAVALPPPPITLPPILPTPPPVSLPPAPVSPPAPPPAGGVLNLLPPIGSPASALGASGAGPALGGAAALAALGDPTTQLPGQDPVPADNRQQGPGDNRGLSQQSVEMSRQQYVMTAQVFVLSLSQDALQAASAGGGSGQFGWPEQYRVLSQPFGCTALRLAPSSSICPGGHFHTGDDIAGPNLAEVFAADTGVVRIFPGSFGYGNYAIVTHGNGYATLYGHLHDFAVKDGDLVRRGDLVGHEGSTGNSTGPHLHFEVRKDGGYLDPCPFLEDCGKQP